MTQTAGAPVKGRRWDLTLLLGIFAFGLVFVLGATWLGQKDRNRYRVEPLAPLSQAEAEFCAACGFLVPQFPEAIRWYSLGEPEQRAWEEGARRQEAQSPGSWAADLAMVSWLRHDWQTMSDELEAVSDLGARGLLKGLLREGQGDLAGAQLAYAAAPHSVNAAYRNGVLLLSLGEREQARVVAEGLLTTHAGAAEAQRLLARACVALQDVGRAKRAYLDVLQLRPGDEEAIRQVKFLDGTR